MPVVGPRFLIEAGFIIAVAVVAGIERLGTWWIIAVVAGAWVVVALVEVGVWARQVAARTRAAGGPAPAEAEPTTRPVTSPPPVPRPRLERPEPVRPTPKAEPRPEPPRIVAVPPPPVAKPEPEPEPEPVPAPEPPPEPELEPVVTLASRGGPREWNLWELERAARDHSGDDVARDEERSYLLMYLREFAGADGILPADFDGLVRDAFGDLLHAVGT